MSTKESMGFGPIAAILILVAYLGFEVVMLKSQRYRAEPLFVHREFVTADQATRLCGIPDVEERQKFQANFQAVQRKALADLKNSSPQATPEEVTRELNSIAADRRAEVDAFIASNGCDHMDVWRWVKLQEVRARLNLK